MNIAYRPVSKDEAQAAVARAKQLADAMTNWKAAQNEGAEGYNPHEDACFEASMKAAELAYLCEWTPEITQQRREMWNARMTEIKQKGIKLNLDAEQKRAGFTFSELSSAVKMHKAAGNIQ